MSGTGQTFNIAELRSSAQGYADAHTTRGPGAVVTPEAVLALVEATEAARWYFASSLPYSNDPDADLAQERLRAALRPFVFPGDRVMEQRWWRYSTDLGPIPLRQSKPLWECRTCGETSEGEVCCGCLGEDLKPCRRCQGSALDPGTAWRCQRCRGTGEEPTR